MFSSCLCSCFFSYSFTTPCSLAAARDCILFRGSASLLCGVLGDDVDDNRADDDNSLDDLLDVGVNAHQGLYVVDDADDDRADQRAAEGAGAAGR